MAGSVAKRVRYWLHRAARVDLRRAFDRARRVSAESGRPLPLVVADMAWCAVRYEAGYHDYHGFQFHLLDAAARRSVLTYARANSLVQQVNPIEHRRKFWDKREFNRLFAAHLGRDWLDVERATASSVEAFLRERGTIVAKPIGTDAGVGIERIRLDDVGDPAALRDQLLAAGQVLIEEEIRQHPDLDRLAPDSVNCLRVITFRDGDEVHVLDQVLKLGTGAFVDNLLAGGLYTVLDDTGRARWPAVSKDLDVVHEHPVTAEPIPGFRVPQYDEVLDLVDRLARVVPEIPYVGWDIAITPDGPVVVEGNYNTGVYWMPPSITGERQGSLPRYLETMGLADRRPRSAEVVG